MQTSRHAEMIPWNRAWSPLRTALALLALPCAALAQTALPYKPAMGN